jgi:cytochrome c5
MRRNAKNREQADNPPVFLSFQRETMNNNYLTLAAPALLAALLSCPAHAAPDLGAAHKLYQANCAQCHGKDLEGAAGPNLADATWLHGQPSKANLVRLIGKGVPAKGMPDAGQRRCPQGRQRTGNGRRGRRKDRARAQAAQGIPDYRLCRQG